MKKVAFISANTYKNPYPIYPIGISYIVTYLRAKMPDHSLDVFDCNFGTYDDLAAFCRNGNYDFIGISLRNIDDNNLFSNNWFVAHYRRVMDTVRANSQAIVSIGGSGFSIYPDILFDVLKPDWAIKGEGEESLYQLITRLEKGESVTDIEGLVYRRPDGTVTVNPRTHYLTKLSLEVEPQEATYYFEQSGMLNIQTKRGCPYGCIFCSYPVIEGRHMRTLDTRLVVENIKELYHSKGITYLFFTDSIFNIQKEYNQELCHRLIESGVKVSWGAYFTPHNLTSEELALYQQAGLTHIEWGTDSLSDPVLEKYNKRFRFQDIVATSQMAGNLGIFHAHFLILGGYGETDATLDETFAHSTQLGLTVYFPYIGMRIYPETRLFEIAKAEGLITSREALLNPTYYVSKEITVATLKERALATGQKWIFPDTPASPMVEKFRAKKRRGPLWEFLRY